MNMQFCFCFLPYKSKLLLWKGGQTDNFTSKSPCASTWCIFFCLLTVQVGPCSPVTRGRTAGRSSPSIPLQLVPAVTSWLKWKSALDKSLLSPYIYGHCLGSASLLKSQLSLASLWSQWGTCATSQYRSTCQWLFSITRQGSFTNLNTLFLVENWFGLVWFFLAEE